MKLTRTLVVVGLLTIGSTAANASTFGWGSSWSPFSSSSYSSQVRSSRFGDMLSGIFARFNTDQQFRRNGNNVVAYVRDRMTVPSRPNGGGQTSEVPLPASGLLLIGALGALALGRRRKS